MKLVAATDASRRLNKKLKEFHRIVNKGEVFEVTDDRYRYLVGMNQFKTAFVELVKDLGNDGVKTTETVVSVPETEEEPEVVIIEPEVKEEKPDAKFNDTGSEVTVEEEIKETEPVQEVPKKKRTRTKKSKKD